MRELVKRAALTMALLAAAWSLSAQQDGRKQFDLYGGIEYRGTGSQTLAFNLYEEGYVLEVSGKAGKNGGGYVIESRRNLEFDRCETLIVRVSGISGKDTFDEWKLLKLELNKRPQQTATDAMRNRNDPDYLNARDGEAEFKLSGITNIRSVNLVFFNCEIERIKIELFYKK